MTFLATGGWPVVLIIHQRLGIAVIGIYLICSLWGIWRLIRGQSPSGGLLATFILGGGLLGLQTISGWLLLAAGCRPGEFLHYVYGAVAIVAFLAGFTYVGRFSAGRGQSGLLTVCCLLLVGVGVRAFMTGPHACAAI